MKAMLPKAEDLTSGSSACQLIMNNFRAGCQNSQNRIGRIKVPVGDSRDYKRTNSGNSHLWLDMSGVELRMWSPGGKKPSTDMSTLDQSSAEGPTK